MDQLRHQKKEGSAVSDRLKFDVKPIAVRSENLVTSIKATNGNAQSGDGISTIIFDIPAMSGGYYLDAASTRFSFNLRFTDVSNNTTAIDTGKYVWLDRGPNSIINRFQLYDQSGHLLEDLQNYHLLYGIEKVCTGDANVQLYRNAFFKEGRMVDSGTQATAGTTTLQTVAGLGTLSPLGNVDPSSGGAVFKGAGGGTSGLYVNDLFEGCVANHVSTDIPLTLTFHSSVFGSGSDKYFPLSALNGFRIVLTLNTASNAFQIDIGSAGHAVYYQVNNPTLYTNLIRVDPAVDRGIIDSNKGTDGRIRIHTQSWRTYQVTVLAAETSKNVVIPVSVSSLKALYFTHTNPSPNGYNAPSGFYKRFMSQYQLFVGSVAIPTTPVICTGTQVEPLAELLRAWHVRLNDQDFSTLMSPEFFLDEYVADHTTNYRSNALYGIELESFSLKDDVIESGSNVLNNNVELRLTYSQAAALSYNLMFFALYDCFLVIDPETGITTIEF